MTEPYDPVALLRSMKLGRLAAAVRENNECTIYSDKGVFVLFKAGACIRVVCTPTGLAVAIGEPYGVPSVVLAPSEITTLIPGAIQDPHYEGLAWQRVR